MSRVTMCVCVLWDPSRRLDGFFSDFLELCKKSRSEMGSPLLHDLVGDVDTNRASTLEGLRIFQEFCLHSVLEKRRLQGEKVTWLQKHIRERVHRRAKASNQISALQRHNLPP